MSPESKVVKGLRRYTISGFVATVGLVGGLAIWASVAEIDGAVIVAGTVGVDENVATIQHDSGGKVTEVLVEDGDHVAAGDPLVEFDKASIQADLATTTQRLGALQLELARIEAQISLSVVLQPPSDLVMKGPEAEKLLRKEQQQLETFHETQENAEEQLTSQISQFRSQINGLASKSAYLSGQISVNEAEISRLLALPSTPTLTAQIQDLAGTVAALSAEKASNESTIEASKGAIWERQVQLDQVQIASRSESLQNWDVVHQQVLEATAQVNDLQISNDSREMLAPVSGTVYDLQTKGPGDVISAGEPLMYIMPEDGIFVVDARVSPTEIDRISTDGSVTIRLPTLDQRTTPELAAKVTFVSPNSLLDPTTNERYYQLTIGIDESELSRLANDVTIIPGMPIEAYVQTGRRTVASYLLKPLIEQFERAFRED